MSMLADEIEKLENESSDHLVSVLASDARPVTRQAATAVLRRRVADELELRRQMVEFGKQNPQYMRQE